MSWQRENIDQVPFFNFGCSFSFFPLIIFFTRLKEYSVEEMNIFKLMKLEPLLAFKLQVKVTIATLDLAPWTTIHVLPKEPR